MNIPPIQSNYNNSAFDISGYNNLQSQSKVSNGADLFAQSNQSAAYQNPIAAVLNVLQTVITVLFEALNKMISMITGSGNCQPSSNGMSGDKMLYGPNSGAQSQENSNPFSGIIDGILNYGKSYLSSMLEGGSWVSGVFKTGSNLISKIF